jgi:hypothetical protein
MAEQATDTPQLRPALAEPAVPVRKRWVAQLGLACMGLWMASLTPLQILLPKQVQNIAPHDKFLVIGLVHAFGAVAAIVATPLVGALSDLPGTALPAGHGHRGAGPVGTVQRVPERPVRQP